MLATRLARQQRLRHFAPPVIHRHVQRRLLAQPPRIDLRSVGEQRRAISACPSSAFWAITGCWALDHPNRALACESDLLKFRLQSGVVAGSFSFWVGA